LLFHPFRILVTLGPGKGVSPPSASPHSQVLYLEDRDIDCNGNYVDPSHAEPNLLPLEGLKLV